MASFISKYSMEILVVIGFVLGMALVWAHHDALGVRIKGTFGLCILYLSCIVLSTLLFADLETFIAYGNIANGKAVSSLGMYFIGSLVVLLVSMLLKLKTPVVLDVYGLAVCIGMCVSRFNCIRAGCCGGREIFDTGLYWPVRTAEVIFHLTMFFYGWKQVKKGEKPGWFLPLTMLSYGIFRFAVQWLRDTESAGFVQSHFWALLSAFIGLSILLELQSQAQRKQKKHAKKK